MITRSTLAGGLAALVTVSACSTYKPAFYEPRLASPPAQPVEYDFALVDCRAQAGDLVESIQVSDKAEAAGTVAAYGATAALDSTYDDDWDDYDRRRHKRHKGDKYDDDDDDWEEAAALLVLTAGIAAIAFAAAGPPAEELDEIYRDTVDHCLIDLGYDVIPPGYDFVGTYVD